MTSAPYGPPGPQPPGPLGHHGGALGALRRVEHEAAGPLGVLTEHDLLLAQGNNPAAWTGPRGSITFTHPLIGVVASIPNSNRATYGQIVVLGRPHMPLPQEPSKWAGKTSTQSGSASSRP